MILTDCAIAVFALGAFWIAYVFVGYPILLALIGMFKRVIPASRDGYCPSVSVLIAARNEEKDIGWKVTETLNWVYPADKLEVLVASDASEDRTDEIVRSIGDSRVSLLRMERRGGKSRALNRLAEQAKGEILFFTDANAHIGPGVLQKMTAHFADSRVGCVTGSTSAEPLPRRGGVIGEGAGVYWGYESSIQRLESRIGSVLVCDGAIFCIRASLFRPLLADIHNDLQTPMDIANSGYWVIYEPAARVIEPDTTSTQEELSRRRRICGAGFLATFVLRNRLSLLRQWQLGSRKVARWLMLIPMLMTFASSIALAKGPVFAALATIQIAFYAVALAGWIFTRMNRSAPRWVSVPFYVVLGIVGALLGVADTILGRRFAVWEIPTLSRGQGGFDADGV